MPTYQQSHPWLNFRVDLSRASWEFWIFAGEALSKCEHLAGVPLGPDAAGELMKIYLAKGALATTAIEGNTLTEDEVRQRIDGTLKLPPSKEYLGIEIDNIVTASNQILQNCQMGSASNLTPETICDFNRLVLKGLELEEHIEPGKLRGYSVGVADYRGAPAADLRELLVRLCKWLAEPWLDHLRSIRRRDQIRLESILKAVIAHLYLAWIHPFGDGNGRTGRLVELSILANAGIPFPAAHLLSNHYKETRAVYYRQLSHASKSGGDVIPFCVYAIQGFVDQLRSQIAFIRQQQLTLFWQNHVHQTLGDSETARRRRYLVLDLAKSIEPVQKSKLTDISVRVLRHYMDKNEKTLTRDLQELERLKLIIKTEDGYKANMDIVLAYLPPASQVV
jgi:Fic family protein